MNRASIVWVSRGPIGPQYYVHVEARVSFEDICKLLPERLVVSWVVWGVYHENSEGVVRLSRYVREQRPSLSEGVMCDVIGSHHRFIQ